MLEPPAQWSLQHAEPFGPLDSVVCVHTREAYSWFAKKNNPITALIMLGYFASGAR